MIVEKYTIEEHTHRFAVWTAARGASKSRLKNSEISFLIQTVELRKSVEELQQDQTLSEPTYRNWLRKKTAEIILLVQEENWSDFKTKQFSYGLAAKIISIYIKTAIVLPSMGVSNLAQIAHPPIDSILLKNINTNYQVKLKTSWSTFSWDDYEQVINQLFLLFPKKPFWTIEHAWI